MMFLEHRQEQEKAHSKKQRILINCLLLMKTMVEKMMKMNYCHSLASQMLAQPLHRRNTATEEVTGKGIKRPL